MSFAAAGKFLEKSSPRLSNFIKETYTNWSGGDTLIILATGFVFIKGLELSYKAKMMEKGNKVLDELLQKMRADTERLKRGVDREFK